MAGYAAGVGFYDGADAESDGLESLILNEDLATLRAAMARLNTTHSKVLAWKFGLDGMPPRSLAHIAIRMRWTVQETERQIEIAIDELRGSIRG